MLHSKIVTLSCVDNDSQNEYTAVEYCFWCETGINTMCVSFDVAAMIAADTDVTGRVCF